MPKKIINIIKNTIPITYRKKIKNNLTQYFSKKLKKNTINSETTKDWKNYKSEKIDIINFSIISWGYRFQRPQQIATQLSKKNHRVFYINNEFLVSKSNKFPFTATKIDQNIFEINLSSPKNYFIYTDIIGTLHKKHIINSIKNLIKTAKIKNPIIKIDHPFWYQVCKDLKIPIIYDCMDDHSQFKETSKNIIDIEKKLIHKSNLIVVTSKYINSLVKKYSKQKNIVQIGNGVDFPYFTQRETTNTPNDIKQISKPIIGYYGAINSWIDVDIIEKIVSKRSDYNLVMIGRIENHDITKLQKYKNFHLLGEKPYLELKNYLDYFDLCIIPFKINSLIKATDPVKLYEFLAAGKKIISSKIPTILKYKKIISFYNNKNILSKLDQALQKKDTNISEKTNIANEHSWENLANRYESIINNLNQKKQ